MIVRLSASSPPLLSFRKKEKAFTTRREVRADFAAPFFPKEKQKAFTAKQAARADLAASFLLKDKKKNVYNKAGMTGGGRGIQ